MPSGQLDPFSRPAPVPLSDADYRDLSDFRYALRRFFSFAEEQARLAGITPQQHLVLIMVRGHPSYPRVTIGEVAERMRVRHHSASLLVDRCVRRGLLQRQEDPDDRRRAIVRLTEEGQDLLDRITHANRRQLGELEGDLFRDSLRQALHSYDAVTR